MLNSFEAGANGYLAKSISADELVQGILEAGVGRNVYVDLRVSAAREAMALIEDADPLADLTETQSQIVHLIAEGHTNNQIAAELHLAEQTVKNHLTRIVKMTGSQRRTQLASLGTSLRIPESRHHWDGRCKVVWSAAIFGCSLPSAERCSGCRGPLGNLIPHLEWAPCRCSG